MNLIIILGLLLIDLLLWVGIFYLYSIGKDVSEALIITAAGIPTGLIGFMKQSEPKQHPTVQTDSVDTVNVREGAGNGVVNNSPEGGG
jgi:hypothetical protein